MGRRRKYANSAERVRAWRERQRQTAKAPPARPTGRGTSSPAPRGTTGAECSTPTEPAANDSARKLFHDANLAALKEEAERIALAERTGTLVDAGHVAACVSKVYGLTTAALLALPERVVPQIRVLSEDEAIRFLTGEVTDILGEHRRALEALESDARDRR